MFTWCITWANLACLGEREMAFCTASLLHNGSPNCAHSLLFARQVSPDPVLLLEGIKPRVYSRRSSVQRMRLERNLESHQGCVNCINFSAGGELLASGSDDLQIVLWDWQRGAPVSKFETGHVANVFQVLALVCLLVCHTCISRFPEPSTGPADLYRVTNTICKVNMIVIMYTLMLDAHG